MQTFQVTISSGPRHSVKFLTSIHMLDKSNRMVKSLPDLNITLPDEIIYQNTTALRSVERFFRNDQKDALFALKFCDDFTSALAIAEQLECQDLIQYVISRFLTSPSQYPPFIAYHCDKIQHVIKHKDIINLEMSCIYWTRAFFRDASGHLPLSLPYENLCHRLFWKLMSPCREGKMYSACEKVVKTFSRMYFSMDCSIWEGFFVPSMPAPWIVPQVRYHMNRYRCESLRGTQFDFFVFFEKEPWRIFPECIGTDDVLNIPGPDAEKVRVVVPYRFGLTPYRDPLLRMAITQYLSK